MGAAFATWLRGDEERLARMVACLRRHELPVVPAELGFDAEEFCRIVAFAPQTRPGRHTILEQRNLTDDETRTAVEDYVTAARRL